jgi:hypothetical protein
MAHSISRRKWDEIERRERKARRLGPNTIVLFAALMSGFGCSTTPADLEAITTPTTQTYSENYQEIYRRVSGTAKRCLAGNMSAYASMAVDSELYSELGYGEVQLSLINIGVRNYYVAARIEKTPTGSKMTVRSGNTIDNSVHLNRFLAWASGSQDC